ncbi:hypothetical protein SESBI_05624 [Sesbania bispinosa]|nr:hypothetical protein SESBI_05624 [Sesbania bispinosa]
MSSKPTREVLEQSDKIRVEKEKLSLFVRAASETAAPTELVGGGARLCLALYRVGLTRAQTRKRGKKPIWAPCPPRPP